MGCCARAGLQQLVFNFEKTKESLSGPVAIVAVGAEVARSDVSGLFQFAAILNINLAVINILPLPVRPHSQPFASIHLRMMNIRDAHAAAGYSVTGMTGKHRVWSPPHSVLF